MHMHMHMAAHALTGSPQALSGIAVPPELRAQLNGKWALSEQEGLNAFYRARGVGWCV